MYPFSVDMGHEAWRPRALLLGATRTCTPLGTIITHVATLPLGTIITLAEPAPAAKPIAAAAEPTAESATEPIPLRYPYYCFSFTTPGAPLATPALGGEFPRCAENTTYFPLSSTFHLPQPNQPLS